MDIFSILTLIGGLAIFLYGMQVMGNGLERRGGGKLKSILESLTSSPIKGVLLGAGVTAIIQSSSATTVMVVGFVNSGIMELSQAISVIMGANVGTTITSWLLSLSGIQSDNVFIKLLEPSSFSPVLAVIGIIFIMFCKNNKKKDTGSILIGFAVLMTGMGMMSGSVAGLQDNETFTGILTLFTNPILGILAGALLTAIIQSSSASVGILQALSVTGSITYANAIPIILGQNIGTCVTAMLSSIGTNKNARRAAVAHLCFNITGALIFMVVFYLLHWFIDFSFINNSINAAGIAIVHTIFNVFSTLIFLPFTKQLEKVSRIIIRDSNVAESESVLDVRLLNTPPIAINQAKKVTNEMAMLAKDSMVAAIGLFKEFSPEKLAAIKESEDKVDSFEDIVGTYLVKLSNQSLSDADSHQVSNLLHCIGDFERISDHAMYVAKSAEELHTKGIGFSEQAVHDLSVIERAVEDLLGITVEAFQNDDLELAKSIEPLEQIVDGLKIKIRNNHIERLQSGVCSIETGFVFSDVLTSFVRTSDHCSNIGVCMLEIATGSYETHEYLNQVKFGGENDFAAKYDTFKAKYLL